MFNSNILAAKYVWWCQRSLKLSSCIHVHVPVYRTWVLFFFILLAIILYPVFIYLFLLSILATPVSRSSSRASTNSRPPSRADSISSDTNEPEVFTTVQRETKNLGGRNQTTMTYQTHVVQTRTVTMPTATSTSTPSRISKIPKPSPARRKWSVIFLFQWFIHIVINSPHILLGISPYCCTCCAFNREKNNMLLVICLSNCTCGIFFTTGLVSV